MAANAEIDPILKKAIRLLHSSNPNSATEMRLLLDELITQRHGAEKTLANTLNKRMMEQLEEMESNFPGLVITPPPKSEQLDEIINLTNSPGSVVSSAEESNLKDFGDLNCCVCGVFAITATNRLIECSKCSSLYHQECHKPPITDEEASEDQEHNWQCDNCTNKPCTSKAANIVQPAEESIASVGKLKSRSSSPFCKQDSNISTQGRESASSSTSSSKHHHHHKSSHSSKSSKSSKHHEGSSSSSSKRKSHK